MVAIEEELNYKILEKRFKEQDRLIVGGKTQKPLMVYDVFSKEEQAEFDLGISWEHVFGSCATSPILRGTVT